MSVRSLLNQNALNGIDIPVTLKVPYSMDQFEADVSKIKPRAFDKYVLPPFMMWFAWSAKTGMGRWPRRLLFTAGLYMIYRNFSQYRTAISSLRERITSELADKTTESGTVALVENPIVENENDDIINSLLSEGS